MKTLINELIIDRYFGIYTRNGLDYILKDYDKLNIYLLDFDNIKRLNTQIGYKNVNNIFYKMFEEFKNEYVVGRAFSGDEILVCSSDFVDIEKIENICSKFDMSFKYVYAKTNNNTTEIIDKLIDKLHK